MHEFLFDGKATLAALRSLADLLAARAVEHQTLIIVGGSYLALNDLRESTRDIDSVTRLQAVTKQAISEIGQQHGYANDWLNDSAAAFRPSGLRIEDCTVLFYHHALTILGPTADWIFLMKLYAGRTIDHQDLTRLWPRTKFRNSDEVIERFYDAYPFAPEDPYLADYIEAIATAEQKRPE